MADNDDKVVEGEVVSEESDESKGSDKSDKSDKLDVSDGPDTSGESEQSDASESAGGNFGEVASLENLIKTNNSQIAKLSEELSEARQMLKDAFEGDTTYREHADAAKDANKIKNATRAQILKRPEVAQIATNVKVLTSELKELKEALSDYLREFSRVSGITEIEGDDGELLEIVYVAKLVRKPR